MNSISGRQEALPIQPQAEPSSVDTIKAAFQTLYDKVQLLESQKASLEEANRKITAEKEALVKKYEHFKPNTVGVLVPSARTRQDTSTLFEAIKTENESLRTKVREGLRERREFQKERLLWHNTGQAITKRMREIEQANKDLTEKNEKITAEKGVLQSRLQLPEMAFHILHPQILERAHLIAENHYLRKRISELTDTRRP